MLGIKSIAHFIPDEYKDNFQLAESLGREESFILNKIGAHQLPIMSESDDTSDLATKAAQNLLKKNNILAEDIDCICVCTQNPDGEGLPHTSAVVHSKLECSELCAAFDISLGCSGYVYGLTVITGFMEKAGLKKGILITADPYSKIVDPNDENTALLFGDAATATLIEENATYSLGRAIFNSNGSKGGVLKKSNSALHMNGRQVFNFAAIEVPRQINSLLKKQSIDKEGVDLYVLHQGSKFIVETLAKKLGVPLEKIPVALEKTGNTVSSSIPLVLEKFVEQAAVKTVLISGFGVGLSWASMLLHKN